MGELKTKYSIEITKTGDGAAAAAKDFQAVDAAAKAANVGMAAANTGSAALLKTTNGTAAAFRALNPVLTLVGMQSFPQLASAGMLAKSSLDAVKASGMAMNASLATTSAGIAGLVALLVSAGFAWSAFKAQQEEALSSQAVDEQTKAFGADLKAQLQEMKDQGDITLATFERLVGLAGTLGGNAQIRAFLKDEQRGNAQDRIADLEREIALTDSLRAAQGKNLATEAAAKQILAERTALYEQLGAEGLITNREMVELADRATIAFNNQVAAMNRVKAPLTQLQQLGRAITEQFASGLSSALVDSFTKGGDALKQFAAQFFRTVAQMILQALIMRALFGASGASSGTGGLIGGLINGAATGGMFPRMMAAGGMQGVSEVSSPTLFPRFNVLAGEAGREVMTVLARPRFMAVGGMQAVVGKAGNNTLAITDADELAARGGGGSGGNVVVEVRLGPDLEGRIVKNSIKGAVVTVTNDMARDSKLSRTTKQLR